MAKNDDKKSGGGDAGKAKAKAAEQAKPAVPASSPGSTGSTAVAATHAASGLNIDGVAPVANLISEPTVTQDAQRGIETHPPKPDANPVTSDTASADQHESDVKASKPAKPTVPAPKVFAFRSRHSGRFIHRDIEFVGGVFRTSNESVADALRASPSCGNDYVEIDAVN